MKKGIYKYVDDGIPGGGYITIEVSETAKSYTFKLIENTCRYEQWRITSLFNMNKKAVINKSKSKHAICDYGDNFVIYPYRDGIPYYFEYIQQAIGNYHNGSNS